MLKILFALNQSSDNEIEEKIKEKYNIKTSKTFEYKSEYYLSGIWKELEDGEFDLLIIKEDLEGDSTRIQDLDNMTDKFPSLRVIFIANDYHESDNYIKQLFNLGVYDILFKDDLTLNNLVELIENPRSKINAKVYLDIDNVETVKENQSSDPIPFMELDRIVRSLDKDTKEEISEIFDKVEKEYDEKQMLYLVSALPEKTKENLRTSKNEKYKTLEKKWILLGDNYNEQGETEKESKDNAKQEKSKRKKDIRIVKEFSVLNKNTIGVINLSKGAGSTFVTLNLAKAISESSLKVAVIEPPVRKPTIYDTIGIEKQIYDIYDEDIFYSYPHVIQREEEAEREREVLLDGIYWIVPDPRIKEIEKWDSYKMLKLINSSRKASINIIDIGNDYKHESISDILGNLDMIIVVIDPFPSKIINNEEKLDNLKKLENKGLNIKYVINKDNKGVNKKTMLKFLEINPLTYIPFISPEIVYKSFYDCEIPYSNSKGNEELKEAYYEILKHLVPTDLLEQSKNNKAKKGLLSFIKR